MVKHELAFLLIEDYSGQELPTLLELKSKYGVSVNTIMKAIAFLKKKRYVVNDHVEAKIVEVKND